MFSPIILPFSLMEICFGLFRSRRVHVGHIAVDFFFCPLEIIVDVILLSLKTLK